MKPTPSKQITSTIISKMDKESGYDSSHSANDSPQMNQLNSKISYSNVIEPGMVESNPVITSPNFFSEVVTDNNIKPSSDESKLHDILMSGSQILYDVRKHSNLFNRDQLSKLFLNESMPDKSNSYVTSRNMHSESVQKDIHCKQYSVGSSFVEDQFNSLKINGVLLTNQVDYIRNLIKPLLDMNLDRSSLIYFHNNQIPSVQQQILSLQESLKDYIKLKDFDNQLASCATDVILDAFTSISKVRSMYLSRGLFKKSQGHLLYSDLTKYTPDSILDIYEFFRRFDKITFDFDYSQEKAELLFNKYLSNDLQEEVSRYVYDYEAIKKYLIHKYGSPDNILPFLLKPFLKLQVPNEMQNPEDSLVYFRKLQAVMGKIKSFLCPNFEYSKEFEVYVYTQDFLQKLIQLTPKEAKYEFFDLWNQGHENNLHIKGKGAFHLLLKTVLKHYDRVSCLCSISDNIKDLKNVSGSPLKKYSSRPCSTATPQFDDSKPLNMSTKKSKANVGRHNLISEIKYPCVLPGHHHSLVDCKEFLRTSVKKRVTARKSVKFKHCAVCLQSSNNCKGGYCSNFKSIPQVLTCRDCKILHKIDTNRPAYSVHFCLTESHYKPPDSEIVDALKKYMEFS